MLADTRQASKGKKADDSKIMPYFTMCCVGVGGVGVGAHRSADQLVESALRPDQLVVSALASRVCASARPLVLVHSHVPCCVWWCHRVGADQLVESVFWPDQLVGPAFAGLGESALWPDPLLCLFGFLCGCEFWHAHETANVCLCFRSCSCFISDRAVAELILWCVPNGTSQR